MNPVLLTHVTLVVLNLERSAAFYQAVFGAKVEIRPTHAEIQFGPCRVALCTAEVLRSLSGVSMQCPGSRSASTAITLAVENQEQLIQIAARVSSFGHSDCKVLKPPFTPPWGGTSAWISDLDGHVIELVFR